MIRAPPSRNAWARRATSQSAAAATSTSRIAWRREDTAVLRSTFWVPRSRSRFGCRVLRSRFGVLRSPNAEPSTLNPEPSTRTWNTNQERGTRNSEQELHCFCQITGLGFRRVPIHEPRAEASSDEVGIRQDFQIERRGRLD